MSWPAVAHLEIRLLRAGLAASKGAGLDESRTSSAAPPLLQQLLRALQNLVLEGYVKTLSCGNHGCAFSDTVLPSREVMDGHFTGIFIIVTSALQS